MSIIHEALKRQERDSENLPSPVTLASNDPRLALPPISLILGPALLGACGVIAAAAITYLATRPPQITVIVPPTPPSGVVASAGVSAARPELAMDFPLLSESENLLAESELQEPLPLVSHFTSAGPAVLDGDVPKAPVRNAAIKEIVVPGVAPVVRVKPAGKTESIPSSVSSAESGRDLAASKLPEGMLTIALSQGKLEAVTGTVEINDRPADRAMPILVGTRINTGDDGSAAMAFGPADMQFVAKTRAKISRLERRTSADGVSTEDVSVLLDEGAVRSVISKGPGAVQVSTETVKAVSDNGTFMVIRNPAGGISISAEEGIVRVSSKAESERVILVKPGETIRYEEGEWRMPKPAAIQPIAVDEAHGAANSGLKKAGFRINLIPE